MNAQTQEGYVKTLGRPNQNGMPLSGVSVRVKGKHNPVLSKEDGTFAMLNIASKNGEAFSLQEVVKKGYELNENASKSDYVQKERLQALEHAFPQVKPEQAAKLRIYPMSIEPRAELPKDMKDNYHFGEM